MKVLGIGEIVLDKVNLFDDYPLEGLKVQPKKVEYSIGGFVPTTLILLSRLDIKCRCILTIGDDDNGYILKSKLEKENIKVIPRTCKKTKMNTILINSRNGSRTIIKDNIKCPAVKNISTRLINDTDIAVFDRHETSAFKEIYKKKGRITKIILDPSTEVSSKVLKMMSFVDYPIIPIESLEKIHRHEDKLTNLIYLYQKIKKTITVTAGCLGSFIYNGKKIYILPSLDIKAVDTLGAGDIFRGAFIYGVLQRWDLKQIVNFANIVAGLQCTKLGNGNAIPTKKEIISYLMRPKYKKISLDDFKLINRRRKDIFKFVEILNPLNFIPKLVLN